MWLSLLAILMDFQQRQSFDLGRRRRSASSQLIAIGVKSDLLAIFP
jgi:hypothetical protein